MWIVPARAVRAAVNPGIEEGPGFRREPLPLDVEVSGSVARVVVQSGAVGKGVVDEVEAPVTVHAEYAAGSTAGAVQAETHPNGARTHRPSGA